MECTKKCYSALKVINSSQYFLIKDFLGGGRGGVNVVLYIHHLGTYMLTIWVSSNFSREDSGELDWVASHPRFEDAKKR